MNRTEIGFVAAREINGRIMDILPNSFAQTKFLCRERAAKQIGCPNNGLFSRGIRLLATTVTFNFGDQKNV